MSVTNIIVTLVIIGLIVVGGAYFMGYFDETEISTPAGEVEVETNEVEVDVEPAPAN